MQNLEILRLVPHASETLCSILQVEQGALDAPIRAEIFGLQRFAEHGRSLGLTHRQTSTKPAKETFSPRLRDNMVHLRSAYRYIGSQASAGYDISPAAEWLLENFHLLEAQFKEIDEGLPLHFYRSLACLVDPPLAGLPRIYGVAWAFVAHTDGAFDEALLLHFLAAYQESCVLNLNELWALPTTLRVVLMENMRRLADRVAANKAARELANLCSDHLEAYPIERLSPLLQLLRNRGVGHVFLAQLMQRIRDNKAPAMQSYHAWLQQEMPDYAMVQMRIRADQAADNLSVSNGMTALRAIGDADWTDFVARCSVLVHALMQSAVFRAEHPSSRDSTLHAIEHLAKRTGCNENQVAQVLLACIGTSTANTPLRAVPSYWLEGPGRAQLLQRLGARESVFLQWRGRVLRFAFPLYQGGIVAIALLTLLWVLRSNAMAWLPPGLSALHLLGGLALVFPVTAAVIALLNRAVSESMRPSKLHRLALDKGLGPEHRVMVVIPCMLSSVQTVEQLVHRLYLHHLANPEAHAQFALLSDWVDADSQSFVTDAALLRCAQEALTALNAAYAAAEHARADCTSADPKSADPTSADPTSANSTRADSIRAEAPARFLLLHRQRVYSKTEGRWIGSERKRGKLALLMHAMVEPQVRPFLELGALSAIAPQTRYVLTLDSDTELPAGRLRELVAIAAHPYNQPQLDASGTQVVSGYGILQPRIVTPLPLPKQRSYFHWLFSGLTGVDPYNSVSSEVYQDLFAEGTFTGKGLLHVQTMHHILHGRLPPEQVLSHDLLEGALVRCATVTDMTLIEDTPYHADANAARVHRWMRGDWQLLPLIWHARRYGIGTLHRWKMVDNLRRSLLEPMSMLLILLALAGVFLTPKQALAWVVVATVMGPFISAFAAFFPSRRNLALRRFYVQAALELWRDTVAALWQLAMLAHHALLALDAIVRTLYRLAISRKHLLQWTTAAATNAHAHAQQGLQASVRAHWVTTAVMLLVGALLVGYGPYPVYAGLLCLVWAAAPLWIYAVGLRMARPGSEALDTSEHLYLARVARDTWRYFERTVSALDHHLPPDNLQTLPAYSLAHRTSPTNIGLYLLSTACARTFGWIGTMDMLERLEATLATLQRLERVRGHFLNWYDTQTARPLLPQYVSTVDSGNLSGHLLTVAQACLQYSQSPWNENEAAQALDRARARLMPLLERRRSLSHGEREALRCLLQDHQATKRSLRRDRQARLAQHTQVVARLQACASALEALAWQPDFAFLYNPSRKLLHIGFRVAEQQLDAGYYDLLASEARLTSFLAIAKGDVPVQHWSALARMFYALGARVGLRSWSGSMFEYLMPSLVLEEPVGSVLRDAGQVALSEQRNYCQILGVPWGISECAYAVRDHTLAYQYAPQGVPRLALRRTPLDELVIAPYASVLASLVAPHSACENLRALERLGARSRLGFYEALDYSQTRQEGKQPFTVVGTFMAHHQGMSIAALANVLLHNPVRRWCSANPRLEAIAALLHERAPREVVTVADLPFENPQAIESASQPRFSRELTPAVQAVEPTHVLSNGHYSVTLRANGAGSSSLGANTLYRGRDDALRDAYGCFLYLGRAPSALLHSLTQHPCADPHAQYSSSFHAERVGFHTVWRDFQSTVTVWVSPEDDIEFRQIELRNTSDQSVEIDLYSACEPTLAPALADEAHPAFSNLFLQMHWSEQDQALRMQRKPRGDTDTGLYAAHFLAHSDTPVLQTTLCTERQRWQGRNQHPGQAALRPGSCDTGHSTANTASTSGTSEASSTANTANPPDAAEQLRHTGLNPVCVLGLRIRLSPHANAKITLAMAASSDAQALSAVIDKYRNTNHVERASMMSATLGFIRLHSLRMTAETLFATQTLTTALLFHLSQRVQSQADAPRTGATQTGATQTDGPPTVCDRRLLWQYGISGERPILLVIVGELQGMGMLRALAQAQQWWSWSGLPCEIVVLNTEPSSYQMGLQSEILALQEKVNRDCAADRNTTQMHYFRAESLAPPTMDTLRSLAKIILHADGRPLTHHVQAWLQTHAQARALRHSQAPTALRSPLALQHPAPVISGEFAPYSGAFSFPVSHQHRPSRPWVNVLANPHFGAIQSESGGGFTWAGNSRLHQITGWSNDPVADTPSEWFFWQDRKTQQAWSLSPNAWGDPAAQYEVTQGQGYTRIRHQRGPLDTSITWCVDPRSAIKQIHIHVTNTGPRSQQLRAIGMVEWIMGAGRSQRSSTRCTYQTLPLPDHLPNTYPSQAYLALLTCTQHAQEGGFGNATAFLGLLRSGQSLSSRDWTCDRREFFNPQGQLSLPEALGCSAGYGLDPCAAITERVDLEPGQSRDLVFLLGHAASPELALQLAQQAAVQTPQHRLAQVSDHWDQLLQASTVRSPDPLFDILVNRWLLYQTLSCRLWAKAGFYQAGGATGYRDQLQDAMAFAWAEPARLRAQIVLCASRQYPQGDVQHWWHQPQGMGVRTHISDDLLWLVHACLHYLDTTNDTGLLDQNVPFLEGPEVPNGAQDIYSTPSTSTQQASVYEHAALAIERSLPTGAHGLPLMGSGDWNDGMNRVGHLGRGESVWLGFFLCSTIDRFAPIARQRGQAERASRWEAAAQQCKNALVEHGWDGQWFKRAYFDNGQPLGSHHNAECRIDLIAQAWAVLSQAVPADLQRQALDAIDNHLVDPDAGLLRLLTPAFAHSDPSPGYIQSYPQGVRENAGQYAHAGVWALMAQARAHANGLPRSANAPHRGDLAYQYFCHLSPAHRAQHPRYAAAYGLEPYAMAADVYSEPPYTGQGGWSWYTGSAGLMHRAALESIFGLEQRATTLTFRPCLPQQWNQAELTLVRAGQRLHFTIVRIPQGAAAPSQARWNATLLAPGTPLLWNDLPSESHFVIALCEDEAGQTKA